MWGAKGQSASVGLLPGRETIGPLLLMAITPFVAILFVHANNSLGGSIYELFVKLANDPRGTVEEAVHWPSCETIYFLLAFAGFEAALQLLVPGRRYEGPVTPAGHVPVYKANGLQSFFITLAVFLLGPHFGLPFKHTIIADHYAEIITTMCVFSFFFCAFLTFKGLYFPSVPRCADNGTTGNLVMDFYWGTELYPRIGNWDIKMFTNCRFGLMFWALAPLSFAAKQAVLNGNATDDFHYAGVSYAMMVNIALQLVYLAKFYWWETGYLSSIDIMHDRAGYYICWGCLVWVPSVYVSHSYYISQPSTALWVTLPIAAGIFVLGYAAVWINYDADRQRALARSTNGNCMIWGKPATVDRVKYITEKGETKDTLLLTSGWWGVARHFHYIPELAATFFWSVSGGFNHFMPFFYFAFLTFLLADRGIRDDARMRDKYNNKHGAFYDRYCEKVRYIFVPGVY